MPDSESRNRILWEFLQTGSPQQIEDAINRLATASEKLEKASGQLNQTQQKHVQGQPQHQQALEKTTSAFQAASDAAYKFGMGAQWSGIPMMSFIATSGNMINGIGMMQGGFLDLTKSLSPFALGMTAATVGVVGIGLAMRETAKTALEMTQAIQKLSEVSTLSLGEAGRRFAAFSAAFGGAAAGGILTGIAGAQAGMSPVQMFQQLNAARAAGPPGSFFNPFLQGPAQFGLSQVNASSSILNPSFKDPAQYFYEVARDIAARQDPNTRMLEMNRLGGTFGDKGTESLGLLVRRMQEGAAGGKSPESVWREFQAKEGVGFLPNAQTSRDADNLTLALHEMETAWDRLKGDLGRNILPTLTGLFTAAAHLIEGKASPADIVFPASPGQFPGLLRGGNLSQTMGGSDLALGLAKFLHGKVPGFAGGGSPTPGSPAIVGELGPELFVPSGPGTIVPSKGFQEFLGTVHDLGAQAMNAFGVLHSLSGIIDAIGGGAGLADRPLKGFLGDMQGLRDAWKTADMSGMAAQSKSWGDTVGGNFSMVSTKAQELIQAFLSLQTQFPIPFIVEWGEDRAAEIRKNIQGLIDQATTPMALNITAILHGGEELLAKAGPIWELTHDRALNIFAMLQGAKELLAQPGPMWELTHDRSLTIVPTIDVAALKAVIGAIPTNINVGVHTVTSGSAIVPADQADRGAVGANLQGSEQERLVAIGKMAAQAGLDEQGQAAAMAVAKTEAGLFGAVGDGGQSHGAFQFFAGGQLPNFAKSLGISPAAAGKMLDQNPAAGVMWALQGYLGNAIRNGQAAGLSGPDLATFAQRFGQVSENPERAGLNWGAISGLIGSVGKGGQDHVIPPGGVPIGGDFVFGGAGAGVSTGGGGGGNNFDLDKIKKKWQDLIPALKDGSLTIQDVANNFDASDPVMLKWQEDVAAGMDPVTALNDGLRQLGQTGTDMLSGELPASTTDTLNAFGVMYAGGSNNIDSLNAAMRGMGNTAADMLGDKVPGATTQAGTHMTLLQAVTEQLKSQGLDPTNVSVGDMTGALQTLGVGMPSLNPIIQAFIAQLAQIPRDVRVNVGVNTPGGSGSAGGGGGSGGSGGTQPMPGGGGPAPGTGWNGGEPATPAPPAGSGGGSGGGHHVMAAGGMLMEPVFGMGMLSGDSYLLGEAGPEAVIPNADLRRMSSGGGTTVIVNVSGFDFSDPAKIRQMSDQIGNDIMRKIRVRTGTGRVN